MGKKIIKVYLALFTTFVLAFCMMPYQIQPDITLDELPVIQASTVSGSAVNIINKEDTY